jgi:hypothetical protein
MDVDRRATPVRDGGRAQALDGPTLPGVVLHEAKDLAALAD